MKVVKTFIWLGFVALLGVSVPKVAWVFRSYEGSGAVLVSVWGLNIDVLWIVPLLLSVCIDVLILATTYAVSVDKKKTAQGFLWGFVALLAVISCYANLLYNAAHAPVGSIWSNPFVGTVTPFIVSGVPLFALCYTLILSRIGDKGETLEQRAIRLETERGLKDRIKATNKGQVKNLIMGAIMDAKDIANAARQSQFSATPHTGDVIQVSELQTSGKLEDTSTPDDLENDTEKLAALREFSHLENARHTGTLGDVIDAHTQSVESPAEGVRSVSIKVAAQLLHLSESRVRTLVHTGKLRTSARNRKLVLITSIDAHLAQGQKPDKNQLKAVSADQENTRQTLGFIERQMYQALMQNPAQMRELLELSKQQSLSDFVELLQRRFESYASYITPERVERVMAYLLSQVNTSELSA